MATSGSYDYSTSASAIIKDALIEIGAIADGETVSSGDEALGLRHLNRMVKHWQVSGYNLWTRARGTLTLTAGKGTDANPYTFGTGGDFTTHRPLRIESMRFLDSNGYERPMEQIARSEYDDLPQKDSTGESTLFHYDPQIGLGKLYVWPVLSSTSSGTLVFSYQRPIEDFDAAGNEPDFPQEWYETLVYGLAARIAPHFFPQDVNMQQRLVQIASAKLEDCLSFDKEPASSYFLLDRRQYRG